MKGRTVALVSVFAFFTVCVVVAIWGAHHAP